MRAVVVFASGGPQALVIEECPKPIPKKGHLLIRVHALGLHRAEMFTRQGHSPGVTFPRVLGIEAVGVVAAAPGGVFNEGSKVATVVGGMGRAFDGGYAEYTVVPASNVKVLESIVPWEILGALPEMVQTGWGALFTSLQVKQGETLLIRGGSSSVGLAAAAIARHHGLHIVSTTRDSRRGNLMLASGAHDILIDNGSIAEEARKRYPDGFDKVLELIGVTTLADSLKTAKRGGIVCVAGIVGGSWVMEHFTPNEIIPTGVYLTTFSSSIETFMRTPIDHIAKLLDAGTMHIPIKTYRLEQIVEAHRAMDESTAAAKMVILID
ncbi:MAG: hypothetical protein CYPHOPRED_004699 [Cyphobasidiales sp. Tagirdzhanova-0007]|nr:MAG: hypothetical protein CYPHOPRED_004699 [Cyphobasidiales sp. Tagirdzhanova-0007]